MKNKNEVHELNKREWHTPTLLKINIKNTQDGSSPGTREDAYDFDATPS